jgi:4a-hydroxytetrahydrobiopterin dehydratase
MTKLAQEKFNPVKADSPSISETEVARLQSEIPEWSIIDVDGVPRLKRQFDFKNFVEALEFTNEVGEIAEEQGHHPVITLTWGKATVEWWTHAIEGLHKNDFIMAAKTDELYRS